MSKHCSDCGCILEGKICTNCHEELYIFETQYEDMVQPISDEFSQKIKEQREIIKRK